VADAMLPRRGILVADILGIAAIDFCRDSGARSIFLQNRMRDSVESEAVILCSRRCLSGGLDRPGNGARRGADCSALGSIRSRHEASAGEAGADGDWGFLERALGEVYTDDPGTRRCRRD